MHKSELSVCQWTDIILACVFETNSYVIIAASCKWTRVVNNQLIEHSHVDEQLPFLVDAGLNGFKKP